MEVSYVIGIVTFFVTLILGIISKKNPKFSNYLIPLQNLLIGIIATIIEYIITKDINFAISAVGLFAGGVYDVVNNLNKLLKLFNNTENTEKEGN